MSWVTAIDYRQSRQRRRDHTPCREFGRLARPHADLVLGVMASGLPSARLGHIGAQAAVAAAHDHMRQRLAAAPCLRGNPAAGGGTDEQPAEAQTLFEGLLDHTAAALHHLAREQGVAAADLAATLQVVAAGPTGGAVWQLGEGFLVSRSVGGDYALTGEAEAEAEATLSLVSPDAARRARMLRVAGPLRFLCAASGTLRALSLEDAAESAMAGPPARAAAVPRPRAGFFEPLDTFIGAAGDDSDAHREVRGFLRSKGLTRHAPDDVSLMLCGWQPGPADHAPLAPH